MVNVAEMAIWPSSGQVVKPNFKSDNWDNEIYSGQIKWYPWEKGPMVRLQWFILYLTFFTSRHDNHFCWLGERSRSRSTNVRRCATKRWPLKMEYAAGGNNATGRSTTRYWFCCRGASHNNVQYILCSSIVCAMLLRGGETVFVVYSNFAVVISQTNVAVSPLRIQRKRSINPMQ